MLLYNVSKNGCLILTLYPLNVVSDDIRDKLIARGIPAEEIAYIHDAKTEQQKADLFDNINSNYGRFNSCFFMPPIIRGHFFCWSAACRSAYKRRGSFSEGCGDLGEHRP